MKRLMTAFAMLVTSVCLFATAPSAQTLEAIQKRGKVLIAIDTGTPPYGMMSSEMKPEGIDVDMANRIAKDLGVPLEIVPVTGPNRIAFLLTNKADIVISTFSVTAERAKSIAFTIPYGAEEVVVAGKKDVNARTIADLSGKSVAVVRGTIQDTETSRVAPQGVTIRRYEDDATAASAILAGQVDLFVNGAILSKAIMDKDPNKSLEQKFVLRSSPYSIGVRRNDPDFLHMLNTFIYTYRLDGTLAAIQKKWLGEAQASPLPSF